jgi:hypothetical protein
VIGIAESEKIRASEKNGEDVVDYGWLPAFPHVLIASMSNFLFGYHIGSVFLSLYVGFLFFFVNCGLDQFQLFHFSTLPL